jgi:hypothetical protein
VNDRGQYSDAVLNELESQNDGQVEGIMGKVRQLKDVGSFSLLLVCNAKTANADDNSNRRRNSRLVSFSRKDE